MQERISQLINLPTTVQPSFNPSLNTWFLLDKIRGQQTLNALYQQTDTGIIAKINYLLAQTPHEHLLEVSPLLIKLSHTELNDNFYQQLQQERSGLFIQANDDILTHLQYLFTMQSDLQGKIYVRYYDPIYWVSLQLGLEESQQSKLWGNLLKVIHLAPESSNDYQLFNEWQRPAHLPNTGYQTPDTDLKLNESFYMFADEVKLFYLVIVPILSEQKVPLTSEQRARLFLNVKALNHLGIVRIDYLHRLFQACIIHDNLTTDPRITSILANPSLYEYEKVMQIEQVITVMLMNESQAANTTAQPFV